MLALSCLSLVLHRRRATSTVMVGLFDDSEPNSIQVCRLILACQCSLRTSCVLDARSPNTHENMYVELGLSKTGPTASGGKLVPGTRLRREDFCRCFSPALVKRCVSDKRDLRAQTRGDVEKRAGVQHCAAGPNKCGRL